MAYDVPEFVTKDSRLLPLREIFIDEDCTSAQDSLPKAVDGGRQYSENHDAVQFFCNPIRVGCVVTFNKISYT